MAPSRPSAAPRPAPTPDGAFIRQLEGCCLTTAEIVYRMPDHPLLLQTYIWQDYDQAPDFPVLQRFLQFWSRSLDGPLHAVRVYSARLIGPQDLVVARTLSWLH